MGKIVLWQEKRGLGWTSWEWGDWTLWATTSSIQSFGKAIRV